MDDKIKEIEIEKIFKQGGTDLRLLDFDNNKSLEDLLIYDCIFSHEFAKKFFGKKKHSFHSHSMQGRGDGDLCFCGEEEVGEWTSYCWQYHLQQMVLLDVDEQLKYLVKFLK